MRTINVLGIELKDYPLREALKLTERYMNNGALNVIAYVSQKRLILAAENEKLKNWVEQLDLTLYSDPEILNGAEQAENGLLEEQETRKVTLQSGRQKEIEDRAYLREFSKRAVKYRKKIYLLAASEEKVNAMQKSLRESQNGLLIAGYGILNGDENGTDQESAIVNEINDIAPGIIIAELPFESCCHFVENNRMYINADVILELPEEGVTKAVPHGLVRLTLFGWRKLFRHRLRQYHQREKE